MRRIPVFASLVVLAAVAVMIALGFWQLRRMHQKEALLAHYAAARGDRGEVAWTGAGVGEDLLYRRAAA
jgi:surfeit locus 1 family protein